MYGLYSRAACNQEWLMIARVRYSNIQFSIFWALEKIQPVSTDHCDNCKLLIANATGIVKNFYPLYLGEYKQNGSFNGHPLYAMRQLAQIYDINLEKMIWKNLTTYLYFRKKGMSLYTRSSHNANSLGAKFNYCEVLKKSQNIHLMRVYPTSATYYSPISA